MTRPNLPQCVQAMGCWCAAHAMGAPYTAPCNANEAAARAMYSGDDELDYDPDPDYDPTPYETTSGPDPRNIMRDESVAAMKYKR